MPLTPIDLKRLVKLLGVSGTIAGLSASQIAFEDLKRLAKRQKLSGLQSIGRDELVEKIVATVPVEEMKSTDELLAMTYDELIAYFSETSPSNTALMNIMRELNYKVGAEDKRHLRRFVARQISETALFSSVATRGAEATKDVEAKSPERANKD